MNQRKMNAIITGASRGVGREIAFLFATEKSFNVIAVSRNREKLLSLEKSCKKAHRDSSIYPVEFDLTEIESIENDLSSIIRSHADHIDILINNAGYLKAASFEETPIPEARRMLDTNFSAAAELIRAVIPIMGRKRISHVVNIGSMGGVQGGVKFNGMSYYSASKSALATLTECLAEEFKDRSVFFNCLAFGAVQTEMLSEAFPGYKAPVSANEMARFVIDFAMDGHKFFNGKILPVSVSTP